MLKTLQSKQLHAAGDWQSVNVENPAKIKRIDNILRSESDLESDEERWERAKRKMLFGPKVLHI